MLAEILLAEYSCGYTRRAVSNKSVHRRCCSAEKQTTRTCWKCDYFREVAICRFSLPARACRCNPPAINFSDIIHLSVSQQTPSSLAPVTVSINHVVDRRSAARPWLGRLNYLVIVLRRSLRVLTAAPVPLAAAAAAARTRTRRRRRSNRKRARKWSGKRRPLLPYASHKVDPASFVVFCCRWSPPQPVVNYGRVPVGPASVPLYFGVLGYLRSPVRSSQAVSVSWDVNRTCGVLFEICESSQRPHLKDITEPVI